MGIYDRDYANERLSRGGSMRRSAFPAISAWSITTWLIVINAAIFFIQPLLAKYPQAVLMEERIAAKNYPTGAQLSVLYHVDRKIVTRDNPMAVGETLNQYLLNSNGQPFVDPNTDNPTVANRFSVMDPLTAYGHFSTYEGFLRMEVWRLVTFQFLHANFAHVFFNMFGLYIFGVAVEEYLGKKKYLAFYITCGIFGGLMYMALNLLGMAWQRTGLGPIPFLLFENPATTLVGASAGVFGVIMACAHIRPNDIIQIYFFFSLRLKLFAYGYVLIALINVMFNGHNAGGDAAHIGGAVAGYFFIRNSHLLRDFFDVFKDSRANAKPRKVRLVDHEPAGAVDPDEIDRILAKVKDQGIASLTNPERLALEAERDRHLRRAQ